MSSRCPANVKENWAHLMNGDANFNFVEISTSVFSTGTEEFCVPRLNDLIVFTSACSSGNFTNTFRTSP